MKIMHNWKHRHYGTLLFVLMLAVGNALMWVHLSGWEGSVVSYATLGLTIVAFLMQSAHDRRGLCEICIESMPLNIEAAVKRNRSMLYSFHAMNVSARGSFFFLAAYVALIAGSMIVGSKTAASHLLLNLMNAMLIFGLMAEDVHRRLKPWCPYCRRWDEGGDHEPSPDPIVPESV